MALVRQYVIESEMASVMSNVTLSRHDVRLAPFTGPAADFRVGLRQPKKSPHTSPKKWPSERLEVRQVKV